MTHIDALAEKIKWDVDRLAAFKRLGLAVPEEPEGEFLLITYANPNEADVKQFMAWRHPSGRWYTTKNGTNMTGDSWVTILQFLQVYDRKPVSIEVFGRDGSHLIDLTTDQGVGW